MAQRSDPAARDPRDPFGGPRWLAFAAGLAISGVMVWRSQVDGDQINLLARGWLLASQGLWVPYGNPTSAGGFEPGGLTALVFGLPLELWMDHRAPALAILLGHVVAYLLLDRVVGETLGARGRALFALFYWLAPWRLYFSAFVWNPNWLFPVGALHLWAIHRQRREARFAPTALLVAATGLSFQLHPSALILVLSAAALWWRGYWRPHWGGVAVGALVTFATLVPWALEAQRHPEILPGQEGFPGRGLVYVFPALKGLLYWLRFGSLWCGTKWMTQFDFTPAFGARADALLTPLYFVLARVVGPLTIAGSLLAFAWTWRRRHAHRAFGPGHDLDGRLWLHGYAFWTFAGAACSWALSPTTVQLWQSLIALHAAVLPLVLWLHAALRSRRAVWFRRGLQAYAALSLVLLLGMAAGSGMYRKGGRDAPVFSFASEHPMLRELGLLECCNFRVAPGAGAVELQRFLDALASPR